MDLDFGIFFNLCDFETIQVSRDNDRILNYGKANDPIIIMPRVI